MNRQETFFVKVQANGGETFFPKQAATVRPVRSIEILTKAEMVNDPYTFAKIASLDECSKVLLTLRDRQDRIYMQHVPAAMFCMAGQQLRPVKRFRHMPLDPQRCSAVLVPGAASCQLCIVFNY